jgi:hypothetical protein
MINKINRSDLEIEEQMIQSLDKIEFEMKKIRLFLWFAKKINKLKNIIK